MTDLFLGNRFDDLERAIDQWVDEFASANEPAVVGVERGTADGTALGAPRWYLRIEGEVKDFVTIWITLGQRTVRYETYVLPAPVHDPEGFRDYVLRRNDRLTGAHYSIGDEDALYLRGELPDLACSDAELDRAIGTLYSTVEAHYADLLYLGFGIDAVGKR